MSLPAKPKFGAACNGCGFCCQMERCLHSVSIFGEGPGPCPALETGPDRTWCGLLRNPKKYLYDSLPVVALNPQVIPRLQVWLAHSLAIGAGCDSSD